MIIDIIPYWYSLFPIGIPYWYSLLITREDLLQQQKTPCFAGTREGWFVPNTFCVSVT